jgi:hypothetical protein
MTLSITSDQDKKPESPSRHDLDISIYYILAQCGPQIWRFVTAIKFFVKTRLLSRKSRDVVGSSMSPTLPFEDCDIFFPLRGCLHASDISISLISVDALNESQLTVTFQPNGLATISYPFRDSELPGFSFSPTIIHRISFLKLNFVLPSTAVPFPHAFSTITYTYDTAGAVDTGTASLSAVASGDVVFQFPFKDRFVLFTLWSCRHEAPGPPINLFSVGVLHEGRPIFAFVPGSSTTISYPLSVSILHGFASTATVILRLSFLTLDFVLPKSSLKLNLLKFALNSPNTGPQVVRHFHQPRHTSSGTSTVFKHLFSTPAMVFETITSESRPPPAVFNYHQQFLTVTSHLQPSQLTTLHLHTMEVLRLR